MPPKFLLKFHAAVIKEVPIDKTPITIGRKPDNDIVIDNMAVSSHHAKLTLQGNSYVVEDLQSTNGTFLNGKRIINAALKHNDQVGVGQHTLEFNFPDAPKQEAAAPAAPSQPIDSDATVVMGPKAPSTPPPPPQPQPSTPPTPPSADPDASKPQETVGLLRVIEGKLDQPEYQLTGLLTYIGKSETAAIKVKGMFAPDIAALISKRPNSYMITAVKDGYPKVNGQTLSGQIELKDGDLIEIGGIKFLFQMK